MARLPRVTAKEMAAVLTKLGYSIVRQSGSHAIYKNVSGLRATVPMHSGIVLHPKTVKTILRDTNASIEDLLKLL